MSVEPFHYFGYPTNRFMASAIASRPTRGGFREACASVVGKRRTSTTLTGKELPHTSWESLAATATRQKARDGNHRLK